MTNTLKNANQLFREKNYEDALEIYTKLHQIAPLKIYEDNIKLTEEKIKNTQPQRIHVLFVTAGLKGPTPGGGIATCFYSLATHLAKSGIQVDILYLADPYYGEKNKEYWESYFKMLDIGFFTPQQPKVYGTKEMRRAYQALQFVATYHNRYTNIIYHDFQGVGYYISKLKKSTNKVKAKLTAWCHGNTRLSMHFGNRSVDDWTGTATLYMEQESVRNADEVITPSEYYLNWWETQLNQKTNGKTIKNYIDFETYKSKTTTIENITTPASRYICFYGRLETLKGIEVFINAILEIQEKSPKLLSNTTILFAGNDSSVGPKKGSDYAREMLENKGLNIEFLFNTKPEILFPTIKNSNGLFVFPTLGETSSCVVVESIHHQCAFVASGIPPIKELLHPSSFQKSLATPNCSNDLASKIISQIENPEIAQLITTNNSAAEIWLNHIKNPKPSGAQKNRDHKLTGKDVTIIIPTADRPELLEECLESFKNQTIEGFSISVIDDGSIENQKNFEICKNYGVEYTYLSNRVYKGAACNLAASKIHSKLIIFFDDDDIAYPNLVQSYLDHFNKNKTDIASCFIDVFDHIDKTQETLYVSLSLGGDLTTSIQCNFFGKGSFAIKNDTFKHLNGYEVDDDAIPMVDYRFYLKAALKGATIDVIPTSLYKYRKNSPNSLFYSKKNKYSNTVKAKNLISQTLFANAKEIPFDVIKTITHNYLLPRYKNNEENKKPAPTQPKQYLHWLEKAVTKLTIEIHTTHSMTFDLFTSNGQTIAIAEYSEKLNTLTIKANKTASHVSFDLKINQKLQPSFIVQEKDLQIIIEDRKLTLSNAFADQKHLRKVVANTPFFILP